MPNPINNQQAADAYTDALTISDILGARGGSFEVANASVYVSLQYGKLGDTTWTDEQALSPNTGSIEPGTIGIKFRNFTAGLPARVSASITPPSKPGLLIGSAFTGTLAANGTVVQPVGGTVITGIVNGTTGAVVAGTGFSSVRASAGVYDVTFTAPTPFAATPVITANIVDSGGNNDQIGLSVYNRSASGFRISFAGTRDNGFNFVAQVVV